MSTTRRLALINDRIATLKARYAALAMAGYPQRQCDTVQADIAGLRAEALRVQGYSVRFGCVVDANGKLV